MNQRDIIKWDFYQNTWKKKSWWKRIDEAEGKKSYIEQHVKKDIISKEWTVYKRVC